MKTLVKVKTNSIKNHIHRNRGKYAVLVTASAFMALQYIASTQWEAFMVEKGIDPLEFFCPEEFAELNS